MIKWIKKAVAFITQPVPLEETQPSEPERLTITHEAEVTNKMIEMGIETSPTMHAKLFQLGLHELATDPQYRDQVISAGFIKAMWGGIELVDSTHCDHHESYDKDCPKCKTLLKETFPGIMDEEQS